MRFNEFSIISEKINLGTDEIKPGAPVSKDKVINVPRGRSGFEVAQVQKALTLLGYELPKYGVDGIRGPETSGAIKKFQQDNNLRVDGIPGPQTVSKLNDLLLAKPEILAIMAKFKLSDMASYKNSKRRGRISSRIGAAGSTNSAKHAVDFFVSNGYTREQAAGIVGNLQAESGANLRIDAVGDGGQAYGIAQWHPPRQANFKRVFNKDIRESSFDEQLEFIIWELNNTERRANGFLKSAETAEDAAWAFDKHYERSSGAHREKRMANAAALVSNLA